ncbi:hypothetical protein BY996DRAFT_4575199 [Phakopsora pachyrhizi]|uniref:RRM domain-containing protein n=1 Tax=Phakopsora pachyrhizi TaxID=170000 RepID=A0AAV0BG54_PHAPC|nr:hypothetical protein BY996DRAFT_4575199 [Phakopsora pachyrhizi]CAH7685919.1 hypothetical protein PPACK8108_LOCUS20520 [Phakopsora pachyrhizi]
MGYGQGGHGFGPYNSNPAAAAAAAHSVQANRVYVGNLPYTVGWRELKDFMREAGDVSFSEVLMGPDGRSKGCGVVEFATAEGAQKAISDLSDKPILGRPIFIREDRETQPRYGHQNQRTFPSNSHNNNGYARGAPRQLFISGLAPTVNWRTLKDMFRQSGNVLRAEVINGKGTGTVLMSTEDEANAAISAFNGTTLEESQIIVREDRFANNNNFNQNQYHDRGHGRGYGQGYNGGGSYSSGLKSTPPVDPSTQQPSTQVFVSNLPYDTESAALLELCPSGAVNCEVISVGGRSKGMGVVEFSSLEASAEAIGSLQGQLVGGRPIKVKYNERWHEFSDQASGAPA